MTTETTETASKKFDPILDFRLACKATELDFMHDYSIKCPIRGKVETTPSRFAGRQARNVAAVCRNFDELVKGTQVEPQFKARLLDLASAWRGIEQAAVLRENAQPEVKPVANPPVKRQPTMTEWRKTHGKSYGNASRHAGETGFGKGTSKPQSYLAKKAEKAENDRLLRASMAGRKGASADQGKGKGKKGGK